MKDKIIIHTYDKSIKNGYDYLIKMSLYSFTEEEIEKLNNDYLKIKSEYEELGNKSIETLWTDECYQFVKNYRKIKLKL